MSLSETPDEGIRIQRTSSEIRLIPPLYLFMTATSSFDSLGRERLLPHSIPATLPRNRRLIRKKARFGTAPRPHFVNRVLGGLPFPDLISALLSL
ncbi:hypothetical protein AVEN_141860-1 [Araneus ventricosus]|uniref:Uncharacterized protein n=1 Tax=Araneus ventricosus TaxID=182803 RepID=A0A4Y2L275_ARAVE|nr:hypothetical protein AVEN_141860-1 [Araneus ventricosus]